MRSLTELKAFYTALQDTDSLPSHYTHKWKYDKEQFKKEYSKLMNGSAMFSDDDEYVEDYGNDEYF